MKTITFLIFSATVLIFSNCFGGDVTNQLGGIESASIIAKPISVKVWRTVGSLKPESSLPADFYQKSGKGKLVSTNLAAQLSEVLLNEQIYPHYAVSVKQCVILPGVVATFSNEKRSVDVLFCFDCNVLIVKNGTNEINSDFDPGRPQLLRVIKKIFPKDPQIQSLKEQQ